MQNQQERSAGAIAAAIASGKQKVETELYAKPHDLCHRCDGAGTIGKNPFVDYCICPECGGRGVTLLSTEKIKGLR